MIFNEHTINTDIGIAKDKLTIYKTCFNGTRKKITIPFYNIKYININQGLFYRYVTVAFFGVSEVLGISINLRFTTDELAHHFYLKLLSFYNEYVKKYPF